MCIRETTSDRFCFQIEKSNVISYLVAAFAVAIHWIVLLVLALDARPVVGAPQLRIGRSVRLLGVRQQLERFAGRRVAARAPWHAGRRRLGEYGTRQLGRSQHKVLDVRIALKLDSSSLCGYILDDWWPHIWVVGPL